MNSIAKCAGALAPLLLAGILLCGAAAPVRAQPSAGGIVYGPKGAFHIAAPQGWVLDPSAGLQQGMPCVLYPKGTTWDTAEPLMYAKIAHTSHEDFEAFAKDALADMKEKRPGFQWKRIESGKTGGGQRYFINEYPAVESYGRYERVAYIQLPKAVAYIVFTADEAEAFRKHKEALKDAVKTVGSMNVGSPDEGKKAERR